MIYKCTLKTPYLSVQISYLPGDEQSLRVQVGWEINRCSTYDDLFYVLEMMYIFYLVKVTSNLFEVFRIVSSYLVLLPMTMQKSFQSIKNEIVSTKLFNTG